MLEKVVSFLDVVETGLFNIFRRIVVAFALLALLAGGLSFISGFLNALDGPDVSASDKIEKPDWGEFQAKKAKALERQQSQRASSNSVQEKNSINDKNAIDPRVVKIADKYNAILFSKIDAARLEKWVPRPRKSEFLEGLEGWADGVVATYAPRKEENASGQLDREIKQTLLKYKSLFSERVSKKVGEARVSRNKAKANNLKGMQQLFTALQAIGAVVAIILFLLFFKVELNLRKMIPQENRD